MLHSPLLYFFLPQGKTIWLEIRKPTCGHKLTWECQSRDKDGKVEREKNLDSLMALWNCHPSNRLPTLDLMFVCFLKKNNLLTLLSAADTIPSWPIYSACIHSSYSQKNILPNRNAIQFLVGLKIISPPCMNPLFHAILIISILQMRRWRNLERLSNLHRKCLGQDLNSCLKEFSASFFFLIN